MKIDDDDDDDIPPRLHIVIVYCSDAIFKGDELRLEGLISSAEEELDEQGLECLMALVNYNKAKVENKKKGGMR